MYREPRATNLNNTMAPEWIDLKVVVVGSEFCEPHRVHLTVTKKVPNRPGSDLTFSDVDGKVVLKVNGVFLSCRDRCVLVDATGRILLTMQKKIFSMHRRWKVFRGESTHAKDLMFSVKKSSLLQQQMELDVIMAGNPDEAACDLKIKGSYLERCCTISLGNSSCIVAQMNYRKYTLSRMATGVDKFDLTVYPNIDYAFVAALIVVQQKINDA